MCKIVRVKKLMCLIFMKSTKREKKKKVNKALVLHYSIDLKALGSLYNFLQNVFLFLILST